MVVLAAQVAMHIQKATPLVPVVCPKADLRTWERCGKLLDKIGFNLCKFAVIDDALDSIVKAIKDAGYKPGKDVKIAMDCASAEFSVEKDGKFFCGI